MAEISMDRMRVGESATVKDIDTFSLNTRLKDIGMDRGCSVRCLSVSPLGDPVAYEICGAVIALRRSDARRVSVQQVVTHGS